MQSQQIRQEFAKLIPVAGAAASAETTNRMLTEIAAQLSDIASGIEALTATLERMADK